MLSRLKKNIALLCFSCCLLLLSFYYNYYQIIFKHPESQHIWRQTDGAMFAYNYYKYDANFFCPRLNNLIGIDGKQGAEFPLVYYVAAIMYKIFGFHDWFIRLIHSSIFFLGLFYLFKLSQKIFKHNFYAIYLPLIVFSSPLIVYYANNFLPDVAAFSLAIISVYYYILYKENAQKRNLFIFSICSSIAGLLKITFLLSGGIILLFELINYKQLKYDFKIISYFLFPFFIAFCWYFWIGIYNHINENNYFLLSIKSIFESDKEDIEYCLTRFYNEWRLVIYHAYFWIAIIASLLFNFIVAFKKEWNLFFLQLILFFASIANYLLFFVQFIHHDYYFISIVLNLVGTIFISIYLYCKYYTTFSNHYITKSLLVTLLLFNIYQTKKIMNERYIHFVWDDQYETYFEMSSYLRSIGISEEEKIVSLGEYSSGISLYFMQNRGWNGYDWTPTKVNDIVDNQLINNYIKNGAKYVVIKNDAKEKFNWLLPRLNQMGTFKEVTVFKINV